MRAMGRLSSGCTRSAEAEGTGQHRRAEGPFEEAHGKTSLLSAVVQAQYAPRLGRGEVSARRQNLQRGGVSHQERRVSSHTEKIEQKERFLTLLSSYFEELTRKIGKNLFVLNIFCETFIFPIDKRNIFSYNNMTRISNRRGKIWIFVKL